MGCSDDREIGRIRSEAWKDSWLSYDNCGRSDINTAGILLLELHPRPSLEIAFG